MPLESTACFYISYLIAFYLEDDLNGAKYLWKRVPPFLKVVGDTAQLMDLTNVWHVGKYLFEDNVPLAIQYLCTRNWMPNMHPLIQVTGGITLFSYDNYFINIIWCCSVIA